MPHIVIKLYPGRNQDVKQQLADKVAEVVSDIAKCDLSAISVGIEETPPNDWPEKVYKPDIQDKADTLFVRPGYDPFK